jgi:hypothetical protein
MNNSRSKRNRVGLMIVCAALLAVASMPLLSSAKAGSLSLSINVLNNSNGEIRHLYLSSATDDNWGPDQLNSTVLRTGDSFALNNVSCADAQIRVIAEDSEGCFLTQVVSCAGNATWTITNDATRDCGN